MMQKKMLYSLSVIFVLGMFAGCLSDRQPKACFGDICLKVELARTSQELERGLQYRSSLPRDAGMLFIFPQDVQASFWMKNTLLPLDMIWLDQDAKVVYIQKNAPPCLSENCPVYGPSRPVRYVLEANAGFADAHDIQVGQEAKIFLEEKKK